MRLAGKFGAAAACFVVLATAPSARAVDFSDPEWPCVQRKVVSLSIGQMWAGPPIEEALLNGGWRQAEDAKALAPALAARRTSMEEAEALIAAFAARGETDEARLSALFAGVFSLIERERTTIIAGIARYARKQAELAANIDVKRDALEELRAVEKPSFDQSDRIEELEDGLAWETRIFKDRAQSLRYVCETPVILERRLFALARSIVSHID